MLEDTSAAARIERFGLDRLPYEQAAKPVHDLVKLPGVRALVTGGGGANLGQAVVNRLAAAGATVAVADIDGAAASQVANEAAERWTAKAYAVAGDTSEWDGAHEVVAQAKAALGGLDLLVNNVGGGAGGFASMDLNRIQQVVATTLLSTLYASRAALDEMLPAGRGCIVNISSEASRMADPHITLYSSLKSAINGFTRNLAAEVGPLGVRVVGVAPGMMLGPTFVESLRHPEAAPDRVASMEHALDRISVGRACIPEEVANLVVFLASDAGAHIHGTTISVGGGMSS